MSLSSYRLGIRAAVRGLWAGYWDYGQAYEQMQFVIQNGLTLAWYAGMEEAGMTPADMTSDERIRLQQMITRNLSYVDGFLSDVETYSKANGYKLTPLFNRVETWVTRWTETKNIALTMAQNDPKLEWVLGARKEHCIDCVRLDGKVKRASQWAESDIRPQHPDLECGGWKCGCALLPTDQKCTPGRMPKLSGR